MKAEAIVEVEDPDTVTPEKDAIVWAAFMGLVNEKRRAIGMEELEVTESLPSRDQALNSARAAIGLAPLPPLAITLRHPKRRDLIAMITASVSEPGRFQLTWVDDEGPSGHTTRDTVVEAVRHAVDEGYRLDTASSGMARSLVERLQREREERAAKIESWLTESLPSRGTCGRTPKERRQAEHIADSYEDRGLDARTSKSRGCATVNARRNERMESMPTGAQDDELGLYEARHSLTTRGLTNPIAEGIASGWGLNGAPTYWFMFKRSMAASEWLRESGLVVAVVSATVDGGYSATVLRLTPDEANRLVVMLRRPDLVVGHRWHGHLAAALRETTKLMNTVGGGGSIVGAIEPDEGGAILVASVAGDGSDEMQPHLHVLFLGYGGDGDHAIDLERSGVSRFVDAMTRSEAVESLPKNAGRKGDGFRVGEHVIRIGDEIKMEGQLGGYVRSVDRSKGTAVIEQDNDEVKTWPIASLLHDTAANRQRQQDYNDKLAADAEAKLELSLADWRAQ